MIHPLDPRTMSLPEMLVLNFFMGLFRYHIYLFVGACGGIVGCHWIPHVQTRVAIQAGLTSVALAPTFYGHAGVVPAIWSVFNPPVTGEPDWLGMLTLVIVWGLAIPP